MWDHGIDCTFSEQVVHPTPNGELGGPLLASIAATTSWLTIGATALYYLFRLNPSRDASNDGGLGANSVDVTVSRLGTHLSGWPVLRRLHGKSGWQTASARSILILCDIQSLVGLSLLLSIFLVLPKSISAYHFMLVVQTAWFTHVAQLVTLSLLRHTKPSFVAKWTRIIVIGAFTGLLIRLSVPTIFFGWAYFPNFPWDSPNFNSLHDFPGGTSGLPGTAAICFFDVPRSLRWHYENGNNAWTFTDTPAYGSGVISLAFVVSNLAFRLLRLQGWLDLPVRAARQFVSKSWKSVFASAAEQESRKSRAAAHIGLATLLTARLLSDLVVSVATDFFWLVVPCVWGTVALTRTRSSARVQDSNWTPSQVLPVLLLAGAVLFLLGAFLLRDTPTTLPLAEPSNSQPYTDNPSSSSGAQHSGAQQPNPVLLRESTPIFDRDYSDPDTAPWISPAVALPCLTTVFFTACFFRLWYYVVPNAASLVVRFLVAFLVGIPTSVFFFILLCLAYQGVVSSEAGSKVYWRLMALVFAGSGGLHSLYFAFRAWPVLRVLDIVLLSLGGAVVLLNLIAVVVAGLSRRRGVLAI
ncbi:hypothetical protein B0T16DRAFT_444201 [Cercophora newfieldiana]|uniref:Uncharacterized protein n=1 Tax=Cercophora newfieldiana TaxID=92897 RepID=A0AA39Y8G7_9PEZI|nr:hypothetical protein B0T16DRAFT_444201 [Cercophora newfieldiana]